ncbi:MAG: site-2 protease family protein, partial [Dehalococcoidia bacterium]
LDLLFDEPGVFFTVIPLAILALIPMLVFHEVSHGLVANWMGDDTARAMGRLSWNPLAHLDRLGTIMLLLVGFGWAKPVPINPYRLGMEPRKGMAIVGAAGPLSNFIMAGLFSLLFRSGVMALPDSLSNISFSDVFGVLALLIVQMNVILGILNLIPLPPLDGFRIAVGILPQKQALALASSEQYATPILFGFFMVLMFTGFLWGPVDAVVNAFLGENLY